ncbi:hypothetical protein Tco_1436518, partial [Tanacetum coccineum]
MERVATTASSLEAEQDSEAQIRFEAASKQSNDPPLSRVNTLRSREDTLVDKKKVIISETSIRSDLPLDDAEGIDCLPTATIFAELERTGYENLTQKLTFYKAYFSSQWKFLIHTILQCLSAKTTSWNEFSSTMASAIICLATNQKFNLSKYIFDNMLKNLDDGVNFLMYPRFVQVFLDKKVNEMSKHKGVYVTPSHTKKVFANMKRQCKDSATPTDSYSIPIITQPSSTKPQKKKSRRKQRKDSAPTKPTTEETTTEEHVLDLEKAKTAQAKKITSLKKIVKQLEMRRKLRTLGLKRLRKVGSSSRVESFNDASLGAQEDASKQEIEFKKVVEEPVVSVATTAKSILVSAAKVVTTASASVEIPNELTLAQTLIEIKTTKPKPVTTAATTV